jgi:hypothetical protein
VAGYHVYRAPTADGPFARLSGALITQTNFGDWNLAVGAYAYMVRAVALQATPSGSYYNPSQGIFASVNFTGPELIRITMSRTNSGLALSWNSQSNRNYRVQAKSNLTQSVWADVSSVTAIGSTTKWIDTNITVNPRRFYRVVSP